MPTTGTNLDAQWGLSSANETAYGTPATVDRFLPFDSETFTRNKVTVQDNGLRAGQRFARGKGRVITTRDGTGQLSATLMTSGFGRLFQLACGSSTITQRVAPNAVVWDQVHTPGSLIGLNATTQKGVVQTDGAVVPFTGVGSKVSSLELAIAKAGIAKITVDFDVRDLLDPGTTPTGPTLATAAYSASALPFSFLESALIVGGWSDVPVTDASVKLTNPMKNDSYYLNGSALKGEPRQNALATVDGSMTVEFKDRSRLVDAFNADTSLAWSMTFTSSTVIGATTIHPQLTVTVPLVKLNGETPKVGGPDVATMTVPFEGLFDDTNPVITFALTSGDIAY